MACVCVTPTRKRFARQIYYNYHNALYRNRALRQAQNLLRRLIIRYKRTRPLCAWLSTVCVQVKKSSFSVLYCSVIRSVTFACSLLYLPLELKKKDAARKVRSTLALSATREFASGTRILCGRLRALAGERGCYRRPLLVARRGLGWCVC